jgi:hypothetical protein
MWINKKYMAKNMDRSNESKYGEDGEVGGCIKRNPLRRVLLKLW